MSRLINGLRMFTAGVLLLAAADSALAQSQERWEVDPDGAFELRGVKVAVTIPVTVWDEAGGMRVTGQTSFPARELIHRFGMSKFALGLGVVAGRWKQVHWGVDFILRQAES